MNLLNYILAPIGRHIAKNLIFTQGLQPQQFAETNGVTGLPERIATVYTCCAVISANFSRMPMFVQLENSSGKMELKRHRLAYLLKYAPNGYQNSQNFWSTVEYHRNYFGNAFVRVWKNQTTAVPRSLEIIHPCYFRNYYFERGQLYYEFYNQVTNTVETINSLDVLHFRGMSEDGIIGLSPLVAIERQTNINERATSTMDNFYKNNATVPAAISSEIPAGLTGPGAQLIKDSEQLFKESYTGPENAGKMIRLPMGSKIQTLAMQFADAQLIETLRFTREDISAAYQIPLFMVDGSAEKLDVEQLTTLFKNNTMGPITAIYIAEMNYKLLTPDELQAGQTIAFDILSLIAMDYGALVSGIKEQTTNGLMTPNEGAKKLGNEPIPGKWGNLHFVQAQYIPLEYLNEYSPLLKVDPVLKTNPTK